MVCVCGACLFMTFIVRDRSRVLSGENVKMLTSHRSCCVFFSGLQPSDLKVVGGKDEKLTHLKRDWECSLQNGWTIFHNSNHHIEGGGWFSEGVVLNWV